MVFGTVFTRRDAVQRIQGFGAHLFRVLLQYGGDVAAVNTGNRLRRQIPAKDFNILLPPLVFSTAAIAPSSAGSPVA